MADVTRAGTGVIGVKNVYWDDGKHNSCLYILIHLFLPSMSLWVGQGSNPHGT